MSIISRLASQTGSKEQTPNMETAKYIAAHDDTIAIAELIDHLEDKQKNIRYDCIKTLYEIAYLKPRLIAAYAETFIDLLHDKDNRMQWGAMTALSSIADLQSRLIFQYLDEIIEVARKGSVITMDHCINILVSLSEESRYAPATFPQLMTLLKAAPDNQAPAYAEKIAMIIIAPFKDQFVQILETKEKTVVPESKQKRITKILKQLKK